MTLLSDDKKSLDCQLYCTYSNPGRSVLLICHDPAKKLRRAMDDRFFGAVFQVTRVTNDNYDSSTREVPAALDENG